ncbi:hypothetical protein Gotur_035776, partial [Gossypium turneri]
MDKQIFFDTLRNIPKLFCENIIKHFQNLRILKNMFYLYF